MDYLRNIQSSLIYIIPILSSTHNIVPLAQIHYKTPFSIKDCSLKNKNKGAPLIIMMKPDLDLLVKLSPEKSLFTNAVIINSISRALGALGGISSIPAPQNCF